jgi:D-alanine-D-alanine ligase-like ATP-grasp enzyme
MKKKIAIICGGPSAERGISLNSARSVYDNLDKDKYEVSLIYFNTKLDAFSISETQIYSNTPMDFDFKQCSKALV